MVKAKASTVTEQLINNHFNRDRELLPRPIVIVLMQKVKEAIVAGDFVKAQLYLRIHRDQEREIESVYIEPDEKNGLKNAVYISDTRFQSDESKAINGKTYQDYTGDGLKYFQIAEMMLKLKIEAISGPTVSEENQLLVKLNDACQLMKTAALRFFEYMQDHMAGIEDSNEKARLAEMYLSDVISHHLVPHLAKVLGLNNEEAWKQMQIFEKNSANELNGAVAHVTFVRRVVGEGEHEDLIYKKLSGSLTDDQRNEYQNISSWPNKPKDTPWYEQYFPLMSKMFKSVATAFSSPANAPLPQGSVKREAPNWITYFASPLLYMLTGGQFSLFNRYTEKQYDADIKQLKTQMDSTQSNQKIAEAYETYIKNPMNSYEQFVKVCALYPADDNLLREIFPNFEIENNEKKIELIIGLMEKLTKFSTDLAKKEIQTNDNTEQASAEKALKKMRKTIGEKFDLILNLDLQSTEFKKKSLLEKIRYLTDLGDRMPYEAKTISEALSSHSRELTIKDVFQCLQEWSNDFNSVPEKDLRNVLASYFFNCEGASAEQRMQKIEKEHLSSIQSFAETLKGDELKVQTLFKKIEECNKKWRFPTNTEGLQKGVFTSSYENAAAQLLGLIHSLLRQNIPLPEQLEAQKTQLKELQNSIASIQAEIRKKKDVSTSPLSLQDVYLLGAFRNIADKEIAQIQRFLENRHYSSHDKLTELKKEIQQSRSCKDINGNEADYEKLSEENKLKIDEVRNGIDEIMEVIEQYPNKDETIKKWKESANGLNPNENGPTIEGTESCCALFHPANGSGARTSSEPNGGILSCDL